jgi:hypothetical protein
LGEANHQDTKTPSLATDGYRLNSIRVKDIWFSTFLCALVPLWFKADHPAIGLIPRSSHRVLHFGLNMKFDCHGCILEPASGGCDSALDR